MGELQFFFKASVDRATVLDNFQVLNPTARFFPALLFPVRCPTANAVDGVRRVAAHQEARLEEKFLDTSAVLIYFFMVKYHNFLAIELKYSNHATL